MKSKDIQSLVESVGLDYKSWKEKIVSEGRMKIIDKEGEEYKLWEQNLLERHAIKLIIEKQQQKNVIKDQFKKEDVTNNQLNK